MGNLSAIFPFRIFRAFPPAAAVILSLAVFSAGSNLPGGKLSAAEKPKTAAIGVAIIEHWAATGGYDFEPDLVFFALLGEKGKLMEPIEIHQSNFVQDNRAYLLDAKPGRYAVVASREMAYHRPSSSLEMLARRESPRIQRFGAGSWKIVPAQRVIPVPGSPALRTVSWYPGGNAAWGEPPGNREAVPWLPLTAQAGMDGDGGGDDNNDGMVTTFYYSEALIRNTLVEVGPGEIAVIGTLTVFRENYIHRGDKVQNFYHDRISPLPVVNIYGLPVINDELDLYVDARGEFIASSRAPRIRREFLQQSLSDLKGTPWIPVIQARLKELPQ